MKTKFCSNGLNIDGKVERIYCGSIHYWRLESCLWEPILDNVKNLGFEMIETYIPWQVHELERGRFDFGTIDPQKNIAAFLDLCQQKSLRVIVRPGPHINAEMTYFGYPRRIVLDPEIQALTAFGTPYVMPYLIKQFPVPSYASQKLYAETSIFFDALTPILKKRLYPDGPIVAIQSDNETTYFFMLEPYILDYCRDSLMLYQKFLADKYTAIANLNLIYHTDYREFDAVTPPTGFSAADKRELPYYFDWSAYKEYQIIYANTRISAMWKERGIDLPTFHNMAADNQFYQTPYDLARLEASKYVEVVGIDCYNTRFEFQDIKNRVKFMSGTSLLPFIPEFGSGSWYSREQLLEADEEEFIYLYAYMHGLKAANFYMLVERDRWQGCPITRTNKIRRDYYNLFLKMNSFVKNTQMESMEKVRDVIIIRDYDINRFKTLLSVKNFPNLPGLDTIPRELFKVRPEFGFKYLKGDSPEDDWVRGVANLLEQTGIDYDYTNSHVDRDRLNHFKLAILPTYDFIDPQTVEKLLEYVNKGGTLWIGPGIPYLNLMMRPYHPFDVFHFDEHHLSVKYGQGMIKYHPAPGSIRCSLSELEFKPEFTAAGIEITEFVNRAAQRRIIFAANPSQSSVKAVIRFPGKIRFRALVNCQDISGNNCIEVTIPEYTVCVWEVLKDAGI